MLNIIKMDIFRMLKAKSTWIIIAISIVFVFIEVYSVSYNLSYYNDNPGAMGQEREIVEQNTDENGFQFGVAVGDDLEWYLQDEISSDEIFVQNSQSGIFLLLVAIFAVLFVNGEQRTGYIKNIAGQVSNRGNLVLSKMISCLIFSAMLFIAAYLSNLLISQILLGYVSLGSFTDYLPIYAMQLFLHFAYGASMILIAVLSRSLVASIAIGVMAPMGISSIICSFINMLLGKAGVSESFDISNFALTGNLNQLTIESSSGDFARAIIVSAAFLITSTALSMYIFKKRDIK